MLFSEGFPSLSPTKDVSKNIENIHAYLEELTERLQLALTTLDLGNLSGGMADMISGTRAKAVELETQVAILFAAVGKLQADYDALEARVSALEGN